MAAMHDGGNILYRGQMYSGKTISSIRTIFGYYQDKIDQAAADGQYFCKYGHMHNSRIDCGCKDARFEKMLTPEELAILPEWTEQKEIDYASKYLPKQLS
jgi:hypothetical protein